MLTQGGGVEEAFPLARGIAIHEPDEHGETAGGQGGDTIQQIEVHVDEARVVQEIPWRVPRRGELRENDQIRLGGLRAANRVRDFHEVCVEGANREVQLSERESHGTVIRLLRRICTPRTHVFSGVYLRQGKAGCSDGTARKSRSKA